MPLWAAKTVHPSVLKPRVDPPCRSQQHRDQIRAPNVSHYRRGPRFFDKDVPQCLNGMETPGKTDPRGRWEAARRPKFNLKK
jgi:hypothetical protein